jgi:preprotein translocase subunit SecG
MMARMVQYVKEQGRRMRAWHDRHPRTALFILVSSIGMFASATPALAQLDGLTDLTSALGGGIFGPILALLAALMYAVVQFLILLNSMFADMLISFVQYNTFVDARPVQIGWPLIRDVVNMLFIVVLLAVAFSTIIGYEKLHYKHILPKLLLMAVLINFSKTLVGVMIDFSQVITLTFVNGFKAAAFGNFAKAFSLPTFLDTMKGNNVAGFVSPDMLPTMGKVIISLLFGIVVLTVTSTVLLIMTVYFVARIVILWVVLIFSPIAFFAWAVHGTPLEKVLHHATGEWSSKLTAALTGGPVVAFFLWLTLAVIQGADKPFDGLYKASSTDPATTNPTILDVSRPENMTTMLVAIALLLTGLNTAVSVSSSLDKTLGGLAGKIKSGGGPAGLAARYIAKPGASYLDRKTGLSKKIGTSVYDAGTRQGGLLGSGLQGLAAKMLAVDIKRGDKEKKEQAEEVSFLSPDQQADRYKVKMQSGDRIGHAAAAKNLLNLANDSKLQMSKREDLFKYLQEHGDEKEVKKATMALGLVFVLNTLFLGYTYNEERNKSAIDSVKIESLIPSSPSTQKAPYGTRQKYAWPSQWSLYRRYPLRTSGVPHHKKAGPRG